MTEDAAQTQLANILGAAGKTLADHVAEIRETRLSTHGGVPSFFREVHGLGHGNANLLAHAVRQQIEGAPNISDDLFAAQ